MVAVMVNMADVLRLPYGLMGSYSLFGSDTFLFRKCFKIALFYIIIVARPISEFGVQPAIELGDIGGYNPPINF